eukprot:jgi/Mesen1/44/ME1094593C05691
MRGQHAWRWTSCGGHLAAHTRAIRLAVDICHGAHLAHPPFLPRPPYLPTARSPEEPHRHLVKRLIALQGDWVTVPGSHEVVPIPKGQCWVEGDNPPVSSDSRHFGPVRRRHLSTRPLPSSSANVSPSPCL